MFIIDSIAIFFLCSALERARVRPLARARAFQRISTHRLILSISLVKCYFCLRFVRFYGRNNRTVDGSNRCRCRQARRCISDTSIVVDALASGWFQCVKTDVYKWPLFPWIQQIQASTKTDFRRNELDFNVQSVHNYGRRMASPGAQSTSIYQRSSFNLNLEFLLLLVHKHERLSVTAVSTRRKTRARTRLDSVHLIGAPPVVSRKTKNIETWTGSNVHGHRYDAGSHRWLRARLQYAIIAVEPIKL